MRKECYNNKKKKTLVYLYNLAEEVKTSNGFIVLVFERKIIIQEVKVSVLEFSTRSTSRAYLISLEMFLLLRRSVSIAFWANFSRFEEFFGFFFERVFEKLSLCSQRNRNVWCFFKGFYWMIFFYRWENLISFRERKMLKFFIQIAANDNKRWYFVCLEV